MGGTGVPVLNGAFGLIFIDTSYNWVTGNAMGANGLGAIGTYNSDHIIYF